MYSSKDYEILRITGADASRVRRYLSENTTAYLYDVATLKGLFAVCTGVKVVNKHTKKICGVLVGYTVKDYNCIMYFYLNEELRMKPIVRDIFFPLMKNFNPLVPIKIWSKDISTFSKRVEQVYSKEHGTHYEWTGGIKWAEEALNPHHQKMLSKTQ